MKHPTSKQVQTVIDNFKKVLPMANFECHLNMNEALVSSHFENGYCGTPLCHGGWYAVAVFILSKSNRYVGFDHGAQAMAEHLGFDDSDFLTNWAKNNSVIWGNENGGGMFCNVNAFGQNCNSLQDIVTHWEGVRDRLRALEESQGIFLWDDSRSVVSLKKEKGNPPQPGDTYPERKPLKVQIHELILN